MPSSLLVRLTNELEGMLGTEAHGLSGEAHCNITTVALSLGGEAHCINFLSVGLGTKNWVQVA